MSSFFIRLCGLGWLLLLAMGLFAVYSLQLAESDDYMKYHQLPVNISYLVSSGLALFTIGLFMPSTIKKPSDFFLLFYGLFALLPYAVLYQNRMEIGPADFALNFIALVVPFVMIHMITKASFSFSFPKFLSQEAVIGLIVIICMIGLLYALVNAPSSAGFDISTSYNRRREGRDIFLAGTLSAYLNSIIMNGFSPFLAFIAGWRYKPWLLVVSISCGVGFFYVLGFKAPLYFIVLASIFGYTVRLNKTQNIAQIIYFLLLGSFLLFFIEYISTGFSLTGDYFIRRAWSVPAYVESAYFEFMTTESITPWSIFNGVDSKNSISFMIGEKFFDRPGTNANTNAFLYQLVAGGLPKYVLTILLVASFFLILNAIYACRRNPVTLYLGFSYALLLTEQAATTALVSSGIGILAMLTAFSESKSLSYTYINSSTQVS